MTNKRKATLHRTVGWTIIAVSCVFAALIGGTQHPAHEAQAATPISHVVMILEENHSQSQSQPAMPYLTGLGAKYGHTTNLSAITHPSLPNYLAITSGSTQGKSGTDCGSSTSGCMVSADNIYHQAGGVWSQWSESMPSKCDHANARPYVVHHAPAPFYTDLAQTCPTRDVALSKTAIPAISGPFTFITPNLNDDAHDGTLAQADAWLKVVVAHLMADPAYTTGQTLIEITFDEGNGTSNVVQTVFINPQITARTVTLKANHYSTLRLNEELLGYPLLAGAKTAVDIRSQLGL